MKEYIFEIKEAVCNKETGEVVVMPKCRGELIRCKDCEYATAYALFCTFLNSYVGGEDYCSWAREKKNDEMVARQD